MLEKVRQLFKKEPLVESDLTPRGIASTISDQRTDFNSTFEHMYTEKMSMLGLRKRL